MLIDTDILIDLLRNDSYAAAWLKNHIGGIRNISIVSKLEIVNGCKNKLEQNKILSWLNLFSVLQIETTISKKAENIFIEFHKRQSIGILDSIIAATAIVYNLPLITKNKKHFKNIPELNFGIY